MSIALRKFFKAYKGNTKKMKAALDAAGGKPARLKAMLDKVKWDGEALDEAIEEESKRHVAVPPEPAGDGTRRIGVFELVKPGIRIDWLDVGRSTVAVDLELDKAMIELINQGKESAQWANFVEVCQRAMAPQQEAATDTVLNLDRLIPTLAAKDRQHVIDETNAALERAAQRAGAAATKAVEDYWEQVMGARTEMIVYRLKAAIKVTINTLGIAATLVKLVATGGTYVLGYITAVKSLVVIAAQIYDLTKDAKAVRVELEEILTELAAKLSQQMQSANTEIVKEALTVLGVPFLKNASSADDRLQAFKAKLGGVNSRLNDLSGELNAAIEKAALIEAQVEIPAVQAQLKKIAAQVQKLFEDAAALNTGMVDQFAYATYAAAAIAYFRGEQSTKAALPAKAKPFYEHGMNIYAVTSAIQTLVENLPALL